MSSKWHEKKNRLADQAFERDLQGRKDEFDSLKNQASEVAMGGGDEELFEKKMTKEEKKAAKKAAREAKRAAKGKGKNDDEEDANATKNLQDVLAMGDGVDPNAAVRDDDGMDHETADELAAAGTICTFAASKKGVDARSRDINVQNFTLQHMGAVMLDETEIVLNHGNRYGLIGRNGCGKSTLLKALGARAVPIPRGIDIFFLDEEVEPSDTVSALDAVMAVDEQRLRLEKQAEELNQLLSALAEGEGLQKPADGEDEKTPEEQQEDVMEALNSVYERLDALDAATAEVRARTILKGLGFTHAMQEKKTREFSGGWRMRVSLARALFIQPVWYVSFVLEIWCAFLISNEGSHSTSSRLLNTKACCWMNRQIIWVSQRGFGRLYFWKTARLAHQILPM